MTIELKWFNKCQNCGKEEAIAYYQKWKLCARCYFRAKHGIIKLSHKSKNTTE